MEDIVVAAKKRLGQYDDQVYRQNRRLFVRGLSVTDLS
jgi:hypothetical protein